MELAKIDVAPKNGDFIILQDACSREVGRWAQEANGWVQPDGTPVRISPTHWTRVSDDFAGPTDRERLLFLAALAAPLPDDETEQTQKRPLNRLILALVTAIFCIGGFVFWIGSKESSFDSSAANLEREFPRERDQASVAIGGLTPARERGNVALTEALESKRIANSKRRDLKQALDESQAKSEALARELASARESEVAARNLIAVRERENAAQALETKQIADAKQKELQQALDESEARSEAPARELASARENEVAVRNLAAARERENAVLETKQIADAKQKEFKQALDESQAKSEALARELASARESEVAARNLTAVREGENAAQTLETKQIAEARQKELQQALDESEKRAPTLDHGLTSAHQTIASAEQPSNAEVTARDAAAPTGPLNRPTEQSNAASEITSSMTTPQSRGNVTAGVQASSDATPDDATAGASGRLTRSTQSEPSRPQPPSAMSSAEEAKFVARAESLIKQFDFVGARLLLGPALEKGSARAAFMMAETYDQQILRSLQAYGVRGDAQMAREFYQLAAAAGIEKARERVEALQAQQRLQPNGHAQPNALVQPNAQAQRGERRNGVARVTPQAAQQGRFAARFAARAQGANFRAGTAALAPRRAWSLGLRAAFVPWHGPVFWPYAYSDVFDYAFRPSGYDDGYFAYAYDDFIDGVFWGQAGPPPEYSYAYAPPNARLARSTSSTVEELCTQPGTGITAWPFAEIKSKVGLNTEQKQLLDQVRSSGQRAASVFKASCPAKNAFAMTPPGRLQAMTLRLTATLEAVQTVRPAMEKFYNSLSDGQNERLNEIGPKQPKNNAEANQTSARDGKSCSEPKAGLANLPIERIEDAVKPTNAQEDGLKHLEKATVKAVSIMQAACPEDTPITPPGRLEAMEKRLQAMIDAANTVKAALYDFYGSLSNEQKARFNIIGGELAQSGN